MFEDFYAEERQRSLRRREVFSRTAREIFWATVAGALAAGFAVMFRNQIADLIYAIATMFS